MNIEPKYIKAINFDFDSKELKKLKLHKTAYSILKKEFNDVGFSHRQYSGYVSIKKLNSEEMLKIFKKIIMSNPWILQCAKKIDVTNVIDKITYDFKEILDKTFLNENPFDKGKKAERKPADSTDEEKTQKEDGYKRLADSINKDKAKERLDKIKNKSKSNSDEHIR